MKLRISAGVWVNKEIIKSQIKIGLDKKEAIECNMRQKCLSFKTIFLAHHCTFNNWFLSSLLVLYPSMNSKPAQMYSLLSSEALPKMLKNYTHLHVFSPPPIVWFMQGTIIK